MVLMIKRSSCDKKKTLPDLPGDGNSLRAWSPACSREPLLYLSRSCCLLVALWALANSNNLARMVVVNIA